MAKYPSLHFTCMKLLIVGVNHKSAPVALRERLAVTAERLPDALASLQGEAGLREAAILSTCNRTEVLAVQPRPAPAALRAWLARHHRLSEAALAPCLYAKTGREAVHHAFRVAAGLDSMVLGEPQILGQFKACFAAAASLGSLGPELRQLSVAAVQAAKRVRRETAIGEASVSIAATTGLLAERLFSRLADCRALLLGAGETAALVATHLASRSVRQLTFANRTLARAEALAARWGAQAVDLQSLPAVLPQVELVVGSTSSPLPILGKGMAERAMKARKHKPILMVDLAVPRDIEPEVAELPDIYLYALDDLQQIIEGNLGQRAEAAKEAERLVAQAVADYQPPASAKAMGDAVSRLRALHNGIKAQELAKAQARLKKGEPPEEVVATLANQLVNKIMHNPSLALREAARQGDKALLDAMHRIYGRRLDQDE